MRVEREARGGTHPWSQGRERGFIAQKEGSLIRGGGLGGDADKRPSIRSEETRRMDLNKNPQCMKQGEKNIKEERSNGDECP